MPFESVGLALTVTLLVWSEALAFQHEENAPVACVWIHVTDSFGEPIDSKDTHVRWVGVVGKPDYSGLFRNNFARIPFGSYWLTVTASAASVCERLITVDREEVHITIGLFTRIWEGQEKLSVLSGRITGGQPGDGATHVRIVGLYAEYSNDATVNGEGRYRVGDLPRGIFLVLPMRDREMLGFWRFDSSQCLRATEKCELNLQLSRQH
jgi:hypothetical protein